MTQIITRLTFSTWNLISTLHKKNRSPDIAYIWGQKNGLDYILPRFWLIYDSEIIYPEAWFMTNLLHRIIKSKSVLFHQPTFMTLFTIHNIILIYITRK